MIRIASLFAATAALTGLALLPVQLTAGSGCCGGSDKTEAKMAEKTGSCTSDKAEGVVLASTKADKTAKSCSYSKEKASYAALTVDGEKATKTGGSCSYSKDKTMAGKSCDYSKETVMAKADKTGSCDEASACDYSKDAVMAEAEKTGGCCAGMKDDAVRAEAEETVEDSAEEAKEQASTTEESVEVVAGS